MGPPISSSPPPNSVNMTEWNISSCGSSFVFDVTSTNVAFMFATSISVIGSVLNFIIIVAILQYKKTRRHVTTPFIVSVASTDLVYSAFILPILATRFYNRSWFPSIGEHLCHIFPLVFYANMGTSLFALMVITINRGCMLFFPNSVDKIFTGKINIKGRAVPINSLIIITLCWVIPLIFVVPAYYGQFGIMGLKKHTQSCTILRDENGHSPKKFLYSFGFFLPFVVISLTNIGLVLKIKYSISTSASQTETRFIAMLGLIFAVFVVTFLPGYLVKQMDKCVNKSGLHVFCYILNWCSVWINPVIYVVSQSNYQAAIKDLFEKLNCFGLKDKEETRQEISMKIHVNVSTDSF